MSICSRCGSSKTYVYNGKDEWRTIGINTYCRRCYAVELRRIQSEKKVCYNDPKHETLLSENGVKCWVKHPTINSVWLCWSCGATPKGRKRPEHSVKMTGVGNPMYGRKFSDQHRKNISEGLKSIGWVTPTWSIERRRALSNKTRGEKSHNWQGGLTIIRDLIRNCFEYKNARNEVFRRDGYTCQQCGEKGGKLHAHHIVKSFSTILNSNRLESVEQVMECSELFDPVYMITMCDECHRQTPDFLLHERKLTFG